MGLAWLADGGGVITACLCGAESTGKSHLAPMLAAHYGTVWMPEYGRDYCETNGTDLTPADLRAIAVGHVERRAALGRPALLIEDTDIVNTTVWSEMLFGTADPALTAMPAVADLYLLLDIDTPWIDDGTRFFGDTARRAEFQARTAAELARRGIVPVRIGGNWEQRFERAVAAIDAIAPKP